MGSPANTPGFFADPIVANHKSASSAGPYQLNAEMLASGREHTTGVTTYDVELHQRFQQTYWRTYSTARARSGICRSAPPALATILRHVLTLEGRSSGH
jgi:hypothetical protein